MKYILTFLFLALFSPLHVLAEPNARFTSGEVSVRDSVLGIDVKFDQSGELLSARSAYSHPVDFPDRRGIKKAYIIAEEKAKAQLIRFMGQSILSARIVQEIDEGQHVAQRTLGSEAAGWSKQDVRNLKEKLTEISSSSAHGYLEGLKIIKREYDSKREEATVVVGVNRQATQAARQMRRGLQSEEVQNGNAGEGFPQQPSESAASTDYNQF